MEEKPSPWRSKAIQSGLSNLFHCNNKLIELLYNTNVFMNFKRIF